MADGIEALADAVTIRGSVLAGVSGGADSVALLRVLLVLRDRGQVQVQAVHVNHGLRGADSDGDEAFVRSLCALHAVPLWCYRADPPEDPGEDWARRVRYGFFKEALAQSGAEALVLAHHREDQAETVLLHLMRGAGLDGLCGMRKDAVVDGLRILRPLLAVSRAELRSALQSAGQPWREDATNAGSAYLRNAVRHELLPIMERLASGSTAHIAGTAALLSTDRDTLSHQAEAFLAAHAGSDWLSLKALADLSPGLRPWVLRRWWEGFTHGRFVERTLSRSQTEALVALLDGHAGDRCNLPGGLHGQRGWHCLHLTGEELSAARERTIVSGAAMNGVTLSVAQSQGSPGDGRWSQEVPRAWLADCVLRTRRAGDHIRPFGSGGKQSLQDHLVNRRVDAPFRDRLPLICRGSEVLLIAGVGAGNVPRWQQENDNIRLTWSGDMPWTID